MKAIFPRNEKLDAWFPSRVDGRGSCASDRMFPGIRSVQYPQERRQFITSATGRPITLSVSPRVEAMIMSPCS